MAESFSYALLRAVPSLARGEAVNVGIALHCRREQFLEVRCHLDADRLAVLGADVDIDAIRAHLSLLERVAAGDDPENPVARLDRSDRFGWIVAPSSTIVQPGEVHTGLTEDPSATLERLYAELVA